MFVKIGISGIMTTRTGLIRMSFRRIRVFEGRKRGGWGDVAAVPLFGSLVVPSTFIDLDLFLVFSFSLQAQHAKES